MGHNIEWYTYTDSQMRERELALRELITSGLLSGDEIEGAERLLEQFKGSPKYRERYAQVYTNEKTEDILQRLEDAVFEAKQG